MAVVWKGNLTLLQETMLIATYQASLRQTSRSRASQGPSHTLLRKEASSQLRRSILITISKSEHHCRTLGHFSSSTAHTSRCSPWSKGNNPLIISLWETTQEKPFNQCDTTLENPLRNTLSMSFQRIHNNQWYMRIKSYISSSMLVLALLKTLTITNHWGIEVREEGILDLKRDSISRVRWKTR